MTTMLKAKCGSRKPKPMHYYMNGTELYKKCKMEPGWDRTMALFNAYKHEFTNYNRVATDNIYHNDLDWRATLQAMKTVYDELYELVPNKYKAVCKESMLCSIEKLRQHVAKY
jgi:hypothetical protein